MIKVFTTSKDADKAGDDLTKKFDEWEESLGYDINVKKIHSNSNEYGWMLVISFEKNLTSKHF